MKGPGFLLPERIGISFNANKKIKLRKIFRSDLFLSMSAALFLAYSLLRRLFRGISAFSGSAMKKFASANARRRDSMSCNRHKMLHEDLNLETQGLSAFDSASNLEQ